MSAAEPHESFLTSSLPAGIASPSSRKASLRRSGLPTSVHDDRIRCSTSPDPAFNIPDLVFSFRRIRRSRSSGLHIHDAAALRGAAAPNLVSAGRRWSRNRAAVRARPALNSRATCRQHERLR